MTSADTAFLHLDKLTLAYDTPQGCSITIADFSLSLSKGQICCLLGPSGCGKSTLLRAVAGFEPVRKGSIHLDGQLISAPGQQLAPELRQVGMMFQDYVLFPHLTAAENVVFGLRRLPKKERTHRVSEMLTLVGLPETANAYPHELSGGQQQRIALARALAPTPHLLLLDEPFSNLDVGLREHLASEVHDILHQTGQTAILVTHHRSEADAMADVIGELSNGTLTKWETRSRGK